MMNFDDLQGLLFIGDPQVTARRPGRRLDDDFLATALNKLRQSVILAIEHRYAVVIIGDLFDRAVEMDGRMIGGVLTILAEARTAGIPVYAIPGNHDMSETRVTPETAFAVVEASGLLTVQHETGVMARFAVGRKIVVLGGTPYGHDIPGDVADWRQAADHCLWVIHDDIAFPGAEYPGTQAPHEIQGCELVVNGHIHLEQPSVTVGQTEWLNPGNILRLSIDCEAHVPRVWGWTPSRGRHAFELAHRPGTEVFSRVGRHVMAEAAEVLAELPEEGAPESSFAALLREGDQRTDDGGLLMEDIQALVAEREEGTAVVAEVLNLARAVGLVDQEFLEVRA